MSDPAIAYEENREWTYADYKDWDLKPGERYELLDGAAYAMSAPNIVINTPKMRKKATFS